MPSSITHVRPASPNASPDRYARTAVTRVGDRLGDDDALARGEAVGLDDVEARAASRGSANAAASSPAPNVPWRAVGTSALASTSFIHAFEPSSAAAAAAAPNARCPAASSASTTPATSGSSGPTTTRSAAQLVRERRHRGRVVRARPVDTRRARPSRGCPGAQKRSSTSGERASPHASACSRPPPPMTSDAASSTRRAATRRSGRAPGRHRRR